MQLAIIETDRGESAAYFAIFVRLVTTQACQLQCCLIESLKVIKFWMCGAFCANIFLSTCILSDMRQKLFLFGVRNFEIS